MRGDKIRGEEQSFTVVLTLCSASDRSSGFVPDQKQVALYSSAVGP